MKVRESARVLQWALVLRQLDQGQRATQVASNMSMAAETARAIVRCYEREELESALYEKPHPGKRRPAGHRPKPSSDLMRANRVRPCLAQSVASSVRSAVPSCIASELCSELAVR